ncbi:hypothetical protein H8356DRAFT_1270745 [Neocallimastix lanati (nom. inval.)]|nr:hypothetical protein H8356DRAFT_1270745 [Neocallimastix sp. JGI-2020a]
MEDNIEIEINKSKIYRCTEYKTLINEVLKYESLHNHLKKEIDVSISVAKHKIKEEIKKNSIPMDINLNIYLMPFLKKWDLYVPNIVQLDPK